MCHIFEILFVYKYFYPFLKKKSKIIIENIPLLNRKTYKYFIVLKYLLNNLYFLLPIIEKTNLQLL